MSRSRGSSPGTALFRRCPSCAEGKIYREDTHDKCIYCLELDLEHEVDSCATCISYSAATRRDRRLRVRARGSATPEGRSPAPPSRSASAEPPAKKRHKSSSGTSATAATMVPSVARPVDKPRSSSSEPTRWDKPPSLGPSSSHGRPPSTGPSTRPPSTARDDRPPSTDHRPRSGSVRPVDAPSTQVSTGSSPSPSTGRHSSTSTRPSTAPSTGVPSTPRPRHKSPAEKSDDPSLRELVDRQRRAMRKLEQRLAAQEEERTREREADNARFQAWAEAERQKTMDAWQHHLSEAQQATESRLETYRYEFEALTARLPPEHPPNPIADFQEEARRTLLLEQERIRTGEDPLMGVEHLPSEGEETEEEEADQWGLLPPDPQDDPIGPLGPLEPLGPIGDPPAPDPPAPGSPELAPVLERPARPSPPEDAPSFAALVQRAARHFNLPLETTQPSSSYLLSKLAEPARTVSALPIEPLLWDAGVELMRTPASSPAISSRIDKKYRIPSSGPVCLRGQPTAASIIASSAKTPGSTQVPDHLLSPPSKGSKKWDAMGKRVVAASALQVRTANYGAVLARYDRDMWDSVEELSRDLPEERKQAAAAVMAEGRQISNSLLRVALDSSDSAFRQMNNGIWMRRQGWLADCNFAQEFHPRILNLPFDGTHVFGQEVDALLLQEKTRKETMKAMAPITRGRAPQPGVSQFRQRARGPRASGAGPFPQPQFTPASSSYGQQQYPPVYPAPQRGTYTPRQGGGKRRGSTRGQRPSPKGV